VRRVTHEPARYSHAETAARARAARASSICRQFGAIRAPAPPPGLVTASKSGNASRSCWSTPTARRPAQSQPDRLPHVRHKVRFARPAHGAKPSVRDVVERRPRRDAAISIAFDGVVNESAGLADPPLLGSATAHVAPTPSRSHGLRWRHYPRYRRTTLTYSHILLAALGRAPRPARSQPL
jgi:hypothetical protein